MHTYRQLWLSFVLSLMVVLPGSLLWGGPPALAAGLPVLAVPIAGTVDGPLESVSLSGQALITSALVKDTTFNSPPSVILTIDVLSAQGRGSTTQQIYLAQGTDRVHRTRLLSASDTVEITFPFFRLNVPFFPLGSGPSAVVSTALVSFKISLDATGGLTGASGTIGTPKFE